MIALGNRRLWLCGEPVDMRKGIDGLVAVVQQRLLREAMTGEVFLFVGRDPSRLNAHSWGSPNNPAHSRHDRLEGVE